MQWQERINPNKTPLGAKASRKAGLEQTLTNGNCKAKENDEPQIPEEQSNLTICLSPPPPGPYPRASGCRNPPAALEATSTSTREGPVMEVSNHAL